MELVGRAEGDTIDFRKKTGKEGKDLYGYTYTLTDNKNRLVVSLVTPDKKIVCNFVRRKKENNRPCRLSSSGPRYASPARSGS